MDKPELKHRLSTLDATFLYYEKKEIPFHVGSTMVIDGEISYEEFKAHIAARLPLLVRYQQKIVPAPFNVGHPSWEFDPNFDISNHILHIQLDQPGTLEQLRVLTQQIQGQMLDRSRPLWELYVINGVEGNRSAIITKVHHSMVDGAAGVELLNISFDQSPDSPPPPKPEVANAAPARPLSGPAYSLTGRLFESWLEAAEEVTKSWFEIQRGLLNLGRVMLEQPGNPINRPDLNPLVRLITPVSMLPFNKPNSGQLEVAWKQVTFAEVHAIGKKLGGTINDVLLTAISGAIIRYLDRLGQKTEGESLRFMVPVNMRQEDTKGTMGNIVSTIFVDVPLDLKDSCKRHEYLVKETTELKAAHVAEQYNLLVKLGAFVPAALQALVGSLAYTLVPAINMVCTNVPGPRTALYVQGKKITHTFSYVPFAYAVGLTCTIFSYDGQLFISLSSDGKNMPGLGQQFMAFLDESLAELRNIAGLNSNKPPAEPVTHNSSQPAVSPGPETVTGVNQLVSEPSAPVMEIKQLEDQPTAKAAKPVEPFAEPATITPTFKPKSLQRSPKRLQKARSELQTAEKLGHQKPV